MKLNSKQLRVSSPSNEDIKNLKRNPIYLILDNVLDTYNIGSLFRLADATGVAKVYLCGRMEYPPSSRVHKAAVGTENWVPWTTKSSALQAVRELKRENIQIISVEQDSHSISYKDLNAKVSFPCAVVVGHESYGVDQKILKQSDIIVELPMYGINKSFNVWGSAAVILYKIIEGLPSK
ncbi:MAG: tRNA/rRNA methyltransferase [Candidatus Woesebacteria bacterium GW2011_GWA1_39_21]|uniref:tRNA/rRNA methyltransferase n=1 Tax=Candidatus Woesebacteria bacterium GW2011_GWA1_39_21 TaxID=1618550 RepID=A0A0G0N6T6_9BACT|nr:MAG: tRNA/rRNA methyltransferase [Candidatus Woesebacteria bacterium GW2011_GWA1_39_21]